MLKFRKPILRFSAQIHLYHSTNFAWLSVFGTLWLLLIQFYDTFRPKYTLTQKLTFWSICGLTSSLFKCQAYYTLILPEFGCDIDKLPNTKILKNDSANVWTQFWPPTIGNVNHQSHFCHQILIQIIPLLQSFCQLLWNSIPETILQ